MKKNLITYLVSFSLFIGNVCFAQFNLSGIVKDENKEAIAGAILQIENSQFQTVSTANGSFEFAQLKAGEYVIICRVLGFQITRTTILLNSNQEIAITLLRKPILTDEVNVTATRAGKNAGMAVTLLNKDAIEKANTGQDIPYLLQLLPSVLVTSDAGNGIGYTGIRIRGSDASRINVTVNGIPVNDAESQLVYWVNMPDFASSAEDIEVQRGAGTSTNGAGAFGGSINLLTRKLEDTAYAQTTNAFGSFNTIKNNLSFGTGTLNNHFALEGRLSRIVSNGYIDRGSSDLKSFYFSGGYFDSKNLVRLNIFSGREITYQSWYGVPESRIKGDVQAMNDYIIRNGLSEEEASNLLNSGRNYNYYTYDDQVDNYGQDHYQLLYSRSLGKTWLLNLALHATRGKGYYEEYKNDQDLSDYFITSIDSNIASSDLIRRRWLDNWFYGATWSLSGKTAENLTVTVGGAANNYEGGHFGEVIWARYAMNSEIRHRYYDNDAEKSDINAYVKTNWSPGEQINLYADIQVRNVAYHFTGPNEDGTTAPQNDHLNFFNPKLGITWRPNGSIETYASVSVAHKEPNRDDYTESSSTSRPQPESMVDYETGIRYSRPSLLAGLNLYYMDYYDQLVLTGKVNDVGSYTRTNADRSYRAGIEMEAAWQIIRIITLSGNLTLSDNRITKFQEYTDTYDVDFNYTGQSELTFNNKPIAFSPSFMMNLQLSYRPAKFIEFTYLHKAVGKQFMDNTGNSSRALPSYSISDIRIRYMPHLKGIKGISFDFLINNLLDVEYSSNGYTYGYTYDSNRIQENFYYPQAGLNFIGQLTLKF